MSDRERDWDFYLRTVSNSARDSNFANDSASDPSLLHAVKKLCDFCKQEEKYSEDLVARVYPHINKLFQRSIASLSQSTSSNGILLQVEQSSGLLIGSGIASIQKSTAPEMLLALMDEAYTGSTIGDRGGDSESDDSSTMDMADPLFLELLKDENDGLAERHWTSPGVAAVLQAAMNSPQSDRLKQILNMAPRLLDMYFTIALYDANNSLIFPLIPILMARNSTLFPDKNYMYEARKRLLEFMLAAFQRSPDFIALLKKPIIDRLGEAYDSPEKTELALKLCWAVGEHGGVVDPTKMQLGNFLKV